MVDFGSCVSDLDNLRWTRTTREMVRFGVRIETVVILILVCKTIDHTNLRQGLRMLQILP